MAIFDMSIPVPSLDLIFHEEDLIKRSRRLERLRCANIIKDKIGDVRNGAGRGDIQLLMETLRSIEDGD